MAADAGDSSETTQATHPLPEGAAYRAEDGLRVLVVRRRACQSDPDKYDYKVHYRRDGTVHDEWLCQDDIPEPVALLHD